MATRSPESECSAGQEPVWNDAPLKRSIPSMSGYRSSPNIPGPATTVSAVTVLPWPVVRRQWAVSESQWAASTLVPRWTWGPDAERGNDLLEVGEDLGLSGERPRPIRLGREREGVEVRRDVAGETGISVAAPRAADAFGLFEDHEVLDAGLPQSHRGADAPGAGTDDGDPVRASGIKGHGALRRTRTACRHGMIPLDRTVVQRIRTAARRSIPRGASRGHAR